MEVKGVYAVDRLEHLADYAAISPAFAKAVEFLKKNDLNTLSAGRHEIDGENCFAIVNDEAELVAPAERKVEVHRVYFDIQIPLSGEETYGLAQFDPDAAGSFDEEKDIGFYDQKVVPVTLKPGALVLPGIERTDTPALFVCIYHTVHLPGQTDPGCIGMKLKQLV
jgi:YhcH/YjgK/YiaL family protein